jgi:alpha-beta hydrolase superfamily lysophospholipase
MVVASGRPSSRVIDYGWAYSLRLARLRAHHDPAAYREGTGSAVLLLPGVYETWHFLEPVAAHLNALGHPVHVVPAFGRNLKPIPEMAELAIDYLVGNDLRNTSIVGHSKGGLIGKMVMLSAEGAARITAMVAINSPFGGSAYARYLPIPRLREFVPTHDTITALAKNAEVNARITSVFSEWDPIIPNSSVLEGATNIRLPVNGHFLILDRPDLMRVIDDAIATAGG